MESVVRGQKRGNSYRQRREGYLYVAVLMTAVVVSAMGLAAARVATLRLRTTLAAADWSAAAALAHAAVEDALLQLADEDDWREEYDNDVQAGSHVLGAGSYAWKLVDPDGSLLDDDRDGVRVVGVGRVGNATVAESVQLLPNEEPIACLEVALLSSGSIALGLTVNLATDQTVATNGSLAATALGARVVGNVEAAGAIDGAIDGTQLAGVDARDLPGSDALDYYLDNGTWIDVADLPQDGGDAVIDGAVLSPTSNPFGGSGNPEGIYVIDCRAQRIRIRNSRIFGTLVLRQPAGNSRLEGKLRWDPAVDNYPALLVAGDVELRTSGGELSEAAIGVNFNPAGTPYEGDEDDDAEDVYPAEIRGIVYVTGHLAIPADFLGSALRGTTICATISASSDATFNYRSLPLEYPPPGFARGDQLQLSPGSRRRETW